MEKGNCGFSSPRSICSKSCVNFRVATPACIGPKEMKTLVVPLLIQQGGGVAQTPASPYQQMR